MTNHDKELREQVNTHLSSMKVEEYGTVPQKETLDRIMSIITTDRERACREAEISTLEELKRNCGYTDGGKPVDYVPKWRIQDKIDVLSDRIATLSTQEGEKE